MTTSLIKQKIVSFHELTSIELQIQPILILQKIQGMLIVLPTILVITIITKITCFNFRQLTVTPLSRTINTITQYFIVYDRTLNNDFIQTNYLVQPVPSSAKLIVTFPNQYALPSNITCQVQVNNGLRTTNPCILTSNQIALSNIFNSSNEIVTGVNLWINGVLNPSPAVQTSPFGGSIGTDIAEISISQTSRVQLNPNILSGCSIIFTPTFVNTSGSTMVITATPSNTLTNANSMILKFPTVRWANDLSSTTLPITSTMICENRTSNIISSGLLCAGNLGSSSITITNVFSGTITNSSSFSFAVRNFLSPPSNEPSDQITLTTYIGTNRVDTCNVYVTGLTPKTITLIRLTNTLGTQFIVNTLYSITFNITLVDTIDQNDYFNITLPVGTRMTLIPSSIRSSENNINTANSSLTNDNRTLIIYMTGGSTQFYAGKSITLTLSQYTAPKSTLTTDIFTFQIMRNGYTKMAGDTTITPVKSTFSGNVSVANRSVNANTSYTFTVTTIDPLSSTGKIKIILPIQLSVMFTSANCASLSATTGIAGTPTCSSSGNTITITNINSSSIEIPAQTITITIQGIKNPQTIKPTQNFTIQTFYESADNTLVSQANIAGITALIGNIIPPVNITPSSYKVLNEPTSYRIKFNINNPIQSGGFVILLVPLGIVLDVPSVPNSCNIGINNGSLIQTQCAISTLATKYQINFTNPFSSTISVGTVIQLQLKDVATNPVSTTSVSSFGITTFSSNGFQVAFIDTGLFVQMTIANDFNLINTGRTSSKNYQINTYTLTVAQSSPYLANSYLAIVIPSTISILPNTSCSITSPITANLTKNVVGQYLQLVIPIGIPGNTNIILQITNLRNPPSFAPADKFQLTSRQPNNISLYSTGLSTSNLSNTIPSTFLNVTGVFSQQTLNTAQSLTISFQASTIAPSSLVVTMAPSFVIQNLTCSGFVNIDNGSCALQGNTTHGLIVTGSFLTNLMSFTISGFKTPLSVPTDFTTLISLDNNGFQIDQQLTKIKFGIICALPCKTCSTSNISSCQSCYTSAVYVNIYYDELLHQCRDNCVDGKYQDTLLFKCVLCSDNCLTCQTSATFCESCKSGSTFPYLNKTSLTIQICVTNCTQGMYPDSTSNPIICVLCVSNCATCLNSTFCITCIDTHFFYNNTCTLNCPPGTIKNDPNNNCDTCHGTCATCSILFDNCTTCTGTLILYQNKCLVQCPSPLALQNSTCGPCNSKCLQCTRISSTQCTKCDTSSLRPFLFNNDCLATCPQTYYNNTVLGSCVACNSSINCNNCSSSVTCFNCNPGSGLVFFNSTCLATTPIGYVNISGIAQACSGDCLTCSINTTHCNSCKTLNFYLNQCLPNCPTGYINQTNVCILCQPNCSTCSIVKNNCTSCLANLTPLVYLNGNICSQTCPDFTYANASTSKCQLCVSPCELCTTALKCSSCLPNQGFLFNQSCILSCISGFAGINKICQPCNTPCLTCQNSTITCISCVANTYLKQSTHTCVTNCGDGLYIDQLQQKCIGCINNCKTCVNSSSTCLSCLNDKILQFNQCIDTCPDKKFAINGACNSCPVTCSSCQSLSVCTGCIADNYLFSNFCIAVCPDTHAVIVNGSCQKCGDTNCHKCTSADVCYECISDFSLLKGKCLSTCPTGYQTNGTHCLQVVVQTLTSSSDFPVPFTIAAAVAIIACLMSKLQFNSTFLPGAIYSLVSIIQVGALGYFIYLYFLKYWGVQTTTASDLIPFYVAGAALAYLYLMNFIALCAQTSILSKDFNFKQWNQGPNACTFIGITIASVLLSHKFRNILFSKLFSFSIFSAQLEDVSKFKVFNIFSFLSLLHSGGAIFAAAVTITKVQATTQLQYQCIDVLVVTAIMIVLAFFNVMKGDDFFHQKTPDGYQLNRKIQLDDQIYQTKIKPAGQDGQNQEGYFSKISHALCSNQPFKYAQAQVESSMQSLTEKQYQEASVQALQLLNDKTGHTKFFDMSDMQKRDENSKFTTIFEKVDQSVQNYQYSRYAKSVQHQPPMQIDRSAQNINLNDDRSAQRTIFYQEDASVQMSKKQIKDESVQMSKMSFRNRSIQKQPSLQNKQINVKPQLKEQSGQYSTIQKKDLGIQNYPMIEQRSMQAANSQRDEANQRTISLKEQSIQMGRSQKDYSIQKGMSHRDFEIQANIKNQHANFNEVQEQLPNKSENIIFDQSHSQDHHGNQLQQQHKADFNFPKEQVKTYQQQLEDRIREKQKQLQLIKTKINRKQKSNSQIRKQLSTDKKEPKSYMVDVGKMYRRQNKQESKQASSVKDISDIDLQQQQTRPLKKQERHIAQQQHIDQQTNTIEEIQIVDDDGNKHKMQVQFNNDQTNKTQQQFIDMLEGTQNVLYNQNQNYNQNQIPLQQEQIFESEGKGDNSTKIYSDFRQFKNKRGGDKNTEKESPAIAVSQVDQSLNSNEEEIIQQPIKPIQHYRSDFQDYQKDDNLSNQNIGQKMKKQFNQQMKSSTQTNWRQKKLPSDSHEHYVNKRNQRGSNNDLSRNKERNTILLAGKNQFTAEQKLSRKNTSYKSPLKSPKRWEYQNQDRNLSDSGQFEVPNKRKQKNLIVPFETDKESTQFKNNELKIKEYIPVPKKSIEHQDLPSQYPQQHTLTNYMPMKPTVNQFGSDMSQEPYIDDEDSQTNNRYRNNILMGQMMDRPHKDDLKQYYRQSIKGKSKSKSKASDLQKIYLQNLNKK